MQLLSFKSNAKRPILGMNRVPSSVDALPGLSPLIGPDQPPNDAQTEHMISRILRIASQRVTTMRANASIQHSSEASPKNGLHFGLNCIG